MNQLTTVVKTLWGLPRVSEYDSFKVEQSPRSHKKRTC